MNDREAAMGLGADITRLRLQKKESLQQVADAVGVSKAHIWELEKSRSDNPSMLLARSHDD
jgi:transcriptional regulator with XRE-family HTH domain